MNKSESVYRLLRSRIENREFAPGCRFPSEYRLAEEYGVDKKTANAAVALLVAEGFLKRGPRGAGTIVVRQNLFPRGYIAFVGAFSAFNARILNGVQQTALGSGYAAAVIFSGEAQIRPHLEALADSDVKGVIAAGHAGILARNLNVPLVLVDFDAWERSGNFVINTDNRRGAYELMSEVLRRGHRHIMIYCGGRQFRIRQERVRGFLEAMKERGIADPGKQVSFGAAGSVTDARSFLRKLRAEHPETTIVVCDGDDTAQSLLTAAVREGIPIPGKISITSYGNTLDLLLPVASVEQYPEKIGALACSRVIDGIESGNAARSGVELVKPDVTGAQFIPDLAHLT